MFNAPYILILSVALVALCIACIPLYDYVAVRYVIVAVFVATTILFRGKIKALFINMKKKRAE